MRLCVWKEKKINKKQRLGLALSQIDVTNMLVWWLAFFNNNDGVENDAFAETRNNRELQRWVLNAILDRLDVDVNGNERIDFVTRLAPHLLIDFERHRNHTDDTSTDENENDEDQSTQTASRRQRLRGRVRRRRRKRSQEKENHVRSWLICHFVFCAVLLPLLWILRMRVRDVSLLSCIAFE